MNTMRIIGMMACFSLAVPAAQAAEGSGPASPSSVTAAPVASPAPVVPVQHKRFLGSQVRPHDNMHPVVRVARVMPKETGSPGVVRSQAGDIRVATAQRFAGLNTPGSACDSILCPGYAILGVGF